MRGKQTPTKFDEVLYRPQDMLQLFDKFVVADTDDHASEAVECGAFRHFGLFVFIDSTGSPTTLQVKVQFEDRWSGNWYTHKQGPFAAMFWEDTDTASGIREHFQGQCGGRRMRVVLTGAGTSAQASFATSIAVEFWN